MNAVAQRGHRLHRVLINELTASGCFSPAPVRTALCYLYFIHMHRQHHAVTLLRWLATALPELAK